MSTLYSLFTFQYNICKTARLLVSSLNAALMTDCYKQGKGRVDVPLLTARATRLCCLFISVEFAFDRTKFKFANVYQGIGLRHSLLNKFSIAWVILYFMNSWIAPRFVFVGILLSYSPMLHHQSYYFKSAVLHSTTASFSRFLELATVAIISMVMMITIMIIIIIVIINLQQYQNMCNVFICTATTVMFYV